MQPVYFMFFVVAFAMQDPAPAKSMEDCPLHAQHMAEGAKAASATQSDDHRFNEMKGRGNRSMGFDQDLTTHHFRTFEDGGAIEVTVNEASDATNLAAIRSHLRQVASDFAKGDFSSPLATHGELPSGAREMQRLKGKITYRYEELPTGARVRISSKDAKALEAVHRFLGYQVTEHRTGDAGEHKH